jgi:hypothetical protein
MSRIPFDNKSHKIARRAAQRAKSYLQTVWQRPDDESAPRAPKSRRIARAASLALVLVAQAAPAFAWSHGSSHGLSHRPRASYSHHSR